jgi:membrane dipeptidase
MSAPGPDVGRRDDEAPPGGCARGTIRSSRARLGPRGGDVIGDTTLPSPRGSERARALHREHPVIDLCCPILRDLEYARWWQAGGAAAGFATMALSDDDLTSTVRRIAGWYRQARAHADRVRVATTVADLRAAHREGRLAVVLAFQNSSPFGDDVDTVEIFHRLGVRAAVLAYNGPERAGDGCMEPRDAGLSGFGRRLVAEMNRVGMLVDLSHCGVRTSLDAIDASAAPVAFTHSGAKGIFDHPRTISDEQLGALAARDGFVGINGHAAFLRAGTAAPSLDDVIDHLSYVAERIGIERVGLGLDFSQPPGDPGITSQRYEMLMRQGVWTRSTLPAPPWRYPVATPAHLPELTDALLRRGLSEREVVGVLGENALAFLDRVWPSAPPT